MGNSTSGYRIVYGEPMEWETSTSRATLWFDKNDNIIERVRAPESTYRGFPIFKLQKKILSSAARIVVRNHVQQKQATVIEANSEDDARLGYQYLEDSVFSQNDLVDPTTVIEALRSRQTLPGVRLQSATEQHLNRFPEPMLQPLDKMRNPIDFEADIILLHGLGGGSLDTWTNEKGLWPITWLLNTDIGIRSMLTRYGINDLPPTNKIRVLTVSHHSNTFNIDPASDPYYIAQRLLDLLFHAGVGSKPIVWLAHSLGGLILKEILFTSQDGARNDIFDSTKGVIFFGTPHNGAPWASILRQHNDMHNAHGLRYLDPTPDIGEEAGNRSRLQVLNEFFTGNAIPFLNFSEGTLCSLYFIPAFLRRLVNPIVVSDAQARITGCIVAESTQLAEQMAIGILPPRTHYYCPDRHHLNIAKPSDENHEAYRLTKVYIANWLQRRTAATRNTENMNWADFTRSIVDTVRMYALVIEQIHRENRIHVLTNVSTALSLVLGTMTINEFLILLAFLSGALIAAGAAAMGGGAVVGGPVGAAIGGPVGAAIGGPVGAAVGVIGTVAAAALGVTLALRLDRRIRKLLTDNSPAIREMVNLISAYVMPDFRDIVINAQTSQELYATLNFLRRNAAQTICCVFLEPAEPKQTLQNHCAIRLAVIRHDNRIRQAETVIYHLSQVMDNVTIINSDETEQRVRAILTPAFVDRTLRGTTHNIA